MDSFTRMQEAVGTTFETDRFVVDDEHRRTFEHGSYLTELYGPDADDSGYPDDLIEGFHLLSIIDPVNHADLKRVFATEGVGWNYGLDKVRFIKPAAINVPYRCRTRVVGVTEKPAGIRVRLAVEVLDDDDATVMVADWIVIKVPPGADA